MSRKARIRLYGALFSLALLAGIALLQAHSPSEPIRLGYLGGLSGRSSDLGIDGRNGALLAVEMRNTNGGVNGRPIELVIRDDQQNAAVASEAVSQLIGLKVSAVIGPMTSSIAAVVVPQINKAQLVMLSPTVTASSLTGLDDYFFRVLAATTYFAKKSSDDHFQRLGLRKVTAIYDLRNAAYTESWLNDYQGSFATHGGILVKRIGFNSDQNTLFPDLARQLVETHADGILILANSVDAAMLIQHVRRLNASIPVATSEWAATERLIELGGRSVEGITTAQFIDRQSTQPSYIKFRQSFLERFGREPGFAGLTAFDAVNVILEGIEHQHAGQTLKQALLARKNFAGAQSPVVFDDFGDTLRETYLTTVANGSFVTLH